MEEGAQEHYWSRFAASYDRDGEYVVGNAILQAIAERLRKEQSLGRVIEFGCGTGYFTKAIAGNARQVIATDLSDEMLDIARMELGASDNIAIQKADCRDSPFPADHCDAVVLVNLIHVISDPSRCLEEANRIVRPGGLLVVVDFTSYGMRICEKMRLIFRYLQKWGRPPRYAQSNLSPEELVCLVEHSGFEIKSIELIGGGANALYLRGEKRSSGSEQERP